MLTALKNGFRPTWKKASWAVVVGIAITLLAVRLSDGGLRHSPVLFIGFFCMWPNMFVGWIDEGLVYLIRPSIGTFAIFAVVQFLYAYTLVCLYAIARRDVFAPAAESEAGARARLPAVGSVLWPTLPKIAWAAIMGVVLTSVGILLITRGAVQGVHLYDWLGSMLLLPYIALGKWSHLDGTRFLVAFLILHSIYMYLMVSIGTHLVRWSLTKLFGKS